jgi:hypothetical protein
LIIDSGQLIAVMLERIFILTTVPGHSLVG